MQAVRMDALKPRLNLRKQNRCDVDGEDGLAEAGSFILPYNICEFALTDYYLRSMPIIREREEQWLAGLIFELCVMPIDDH